MEGISSTTKPVKMSFNGEIRRLNVVVGETFENFDQQVRQLFNFPDNQLVYTYQDEEEDWITMSSTNELIVALSIATDKVLKVNISLKQESAATIGSSPSIQPLRNSNNASSPQDLKLQVKQWKKDIKNNIKNMKGNEKAERGKGKMLARFVQHVTIDDDSFLSPGSQFLKTWRFRNETTYPWPSNCYIICVGKKADQFGPDRIQISKTAAPGEEIDVSVPMVAPSKPGRYVGFYRLAGGYPEKKFGQRVRVQIQVTSSENQGGDVIFFSADTSSSSSEDSDDERKVEKILSKNENLRPLMVSLEKMGFTNRKKNAKLLRKFKGDLDPVVMVLLKKQQKEKGTRKL